MHINKKTVLFILGLLVIIGVLVYGIYVYRNTQVKIYPIKTIPIRNYDEKISFLNNSCQLLNGAVKYTICKYGLGDRAITNLGSLNSGDIVMVKFDLARVAVFDNLPDKIGICFKAVGLEFPKLTNSDIKYQSMDQNNGVSRFCTSAIDKADVKDMGIGARVASNSNAEEPPDINFSVFIIKGSNLQGDQNLWTNLEKLEPDIKGSIQAL